MKWLNLILLFVLMAAKPAAAQVVTTDTLVKPAPSELAANNSALADSIRHKKIKQTIIHSAVLPGWGQVNNHQAWKLPFVAAAIGLPVWAFFSNLSEYRGLRQAYIYRTDTIKTNDVLIPDRYKPLSDNSIKFYRDEYRKNVDYSALIFILAWGLNVADAAVFAHLKDFDVSDNLSMRIKPQINPTGQSNVSLVFSFKKPVARPNPFLSK